MPLKPKRTYRWTVVVVVVVVTQNRSYIFPILPIFTQLYRTSVKLQGFFKKRHRSLPVCVLKALECFWRATKGHRGRQIPKYIATLNKKAVN